MKKTTEHLDNAKATMKRQLLANIACQDPAISTIALPHQLGITYSSCASSLVFGKQC